ncbi:hypothetical protein M405DRAFT_896779, partial [Rhizopogon salebrosus TDB-379]
DEDQVSFFFQPSMYVNLPLSYSRLETETNEKLADVYQRLLQAGVDRNESQRETNLKETLSSLQHIFPGESCQQPINDKFPSFAKGVRLAVDVIQYKPAVERSMHHACGNALVCDTMDVARYVCWERGQEVKGTFFFFHLGV